MASSSSTNHHHRLSSSPSSSSSPSLIITTLLITLTTFPLLITSIPIPPPSTQTTPGASSSASSPFCKQRAAVNHAYNIGPDFYLVASSHSIYGFNASENALHGEKHTLAELFGKNTFLWVDTVISLSGFCQKSPLCLDETWRDLERLYIVIGNRRIVGTKNKVYGYSLYEKKAAGSGFGSESFQPLDVTTVQQSLADKLAKIGLPLKQDPQEAVMMLGDFWPQFSHNFYYQSGMFFPERGELLFNVYDNQNPLAARQIVRRRFTGIGSGDGTSEQWSQMELGGIEGHESNFDFTGMFRLNGRTFAMDKSKNVVYELTWGEDDKLVLNKLGTMHEFVNCYQNSSVIEELNEAKRKEATIEGADPAENSVKDKTEVASSSTSTKTSSTTSTTTTTTTSTTQKPQTTAAVVTEPEVEIFVDHKSSTSGGHGHHQHHHNSNDVDANDQNQSGEMREKEESENDLEASQTGSKVPVLKSGAGPSGEDEFELTGGAQGDDPRTTTGGGGRGQGPTLAEASARGPFAPSDDGLIWTFSILVGVLILLSIIILIPILIIRHNARSDRMYINKTTKKSNGNSSSNGNGNQSQNSEEVQLMNSSNIEK